MVSFDGTIALNPLFVLKKDINEDGHDEDYKHKLHSVIQALQIDQKGFYNDEPSTASYQFVIGVNVQNQYMIHLHEQYATPAALEFHDQCAHMDDIKSIITATDSIIETVALPKYQCAANVTSLKERVANRPDVYCLNVTSYVKPEYRDEFIALMESHQQASINEPNCIQFDWGVDLNNPNVFHQHEEFTSVHGFEYHTTTDHFAKFMVFNEKDPYTQPQDAFHFVLL